MDKIAIQNISSATVVIAAPDIRFRRELTPGRTVNISKEDYEELSFDPGFAGLIEDHYIVISGLDEDADIPQTKTPIYSSKDLSAMLDKLDITAFAKFIPTAAPAEKETVVQLAIDKGITNPAIVSLIKKYCDVDVISAINLKHLAEEK